MRFPLAVGDLEQEALSTAERVLDFLLGAPVRILGVVLAALVVRWLLHRTIDEFVERALASSLHERLSAGPTRLLLDGAGLAERRRQRVQTTGSVLRSLVSIVVLGVAVATVLGELGVNLGPLLASAGIVGAALGFGAQNLVRDFLTGAFLIIEDQFGVGDTVDLGTVAGTIEAVGLRITQLRDGDGVVWYVRNGEIVRVGNRSQGWSSAPVDVPVPHAADLGRACELLTQTAAALAADPDWRGRVLEAPERAGIESLSTEAVVLRVAVKCAPNENVPVARELRRRVLLAFADAGIDHPVASGAGPGPGPGGAPGAGPV